MKELNRIHNDKFDQPIVKSFANNSQEILNFQENNDDIFMFNLVNTNRDELHQIFSNSKNETYAKIEYINFLKKQLM